MKLIYINQKYANAQKMRCLQFKVKNDESHIDTHTTYTYHSQMEWCCHKFYANKQSTLYDKRYKNKSLRLNITLRPNTFDSLLIVRCIYVHRSVKLIHRCIHILLFIVEMRLCAIVWKCIEECSLRQYIFVFIWLFIVRRIP